MSAALTMRMLSATCKVCGGSFSMTDAQELVLAAYVVWDKEHTHPAEEEKEKEG